ncbi:alpha/beta hydrolase [Stagonosporopsis vannaccii]|nr:alpha/beta hydrolase [Stagonosporopsis vannaccii]
MTLSADYGSANFLRIGWLVISAASTAVFRITTYPFRSVRAPTLYKDALFAAIRCMMDRLFIADMRYLNASTSEKYVQSYCKRRGIEPKTLIIDTKDGGAVAHWLGDPDADAVILYCHGGGYTQPANEGNFRHLAGLVKDLNSDATKPSVSVLLLAYTLVPEAVFPVQLREAVVVLSHLVYETKRPPSRIFLAGDSAGGNLALSVLSHILHPHPDVFAVKLEQPLGGALLLSPWVSFRTDYPSFKTNATLDMLGPIAMRKWSAMFLGKATSFDPEADPGLVSGDAWTEACLNPSSWWNNMHQVVSDVFIWCGGYEVFLDPIREFKKNFEAGWSNGGGDPSRVVFAESAKESHVAPMVDTMIPGAKKGNSQVAIEEWLKSRIHS